jgi:apolipoprotein N-acyltransferase
MQGETPYMRFGDWPMLIICAVLLWLGFMAKRYAR